MSYDCVIVGGGPAGLTGALYLARFRRSILLVDDGQSRAKLIPTVANYPGVGRPPSGADLLAAMAGKLTDYPVDRESARVEAIARTPTGFACEIGGRRVAASRVLLATGIRDIRPELAGHDEAVRDGLLRYCPICDGYEGAGRRLCVLGPFLDAAAKARFLRSYSDQVTLAYADDPDRASLADLAAHGVACVAAADPPMLRRDQDGVALLTREGAWRAFDAVYPAMGATPAATLATTLGATIDDAGCLVVDDRNHTACRGVYAAGDVVSDLHQIVVAMGHAAVAATAIHRSLPEHPYHPAAA